MSSIPKPSILYRLASTAGLFKSCKWGSGSRTSTRTKCTNDLLRNYPLVNESKQTLRYDWFYTITHRSTPAYIRIHWFEIRNASKTLSNRCFHDLRCSACRFASGDASDGFRALDEHLASIGTPSGHILRFSSAGSMPPISVKSNGMHSNGSLFIWTFWITGSHIIHPASRGVAAHTAGLFRSVRGAKGGFPP